MTEWIKITNPLSVFAYLGLNIGLKEGVRSAPIGVEIIMATSEA